MKDPNVSGDDACLYRYILDIYVFAVSTIFPSSVLRYGGDGDSDESFF